MVLRQAAGRARSGEQAVGAGRGGAAATITIEQQEPRMAWITKNSGGVQIARRDEPYVTREIRDEITRTFLPRYEKKHGADKF